ncbi:MAG: M48 family metalloprotease, partial [Acidimicrobiia bacterium]
MNNVKTVGLLAFMSALVWGIAYSMGGNGFWIGLVLVAVMNLAAYFFSDKIALAASRARPVEEHELPAVYGIVRSLAARAEMPMPRIYVIDSPQPNAFATGRSPKHAAVAVTTGILQVLTTDELEGVLGHELSHVKNRDILISSVAAMLAAALSIFARMAFWFGGGDRDRNNPIGAIVGLVSIILAPFAAMLIRMAISRTRE